MDIGDALSAASPEPYWLEDPNRPAELPALRHDVTCDLAIVGGGYSGLWTALLAKERDPGRDVVVVEANRVGWAASGRNGGFCDSSLTHGLGNGVERFADEMATLVKLGKENLDEIEAAIIRYGIDCDWRRTGMLHVATAQWQAADLREYAESSLAYGQNTEFLDADAVRAEVNSPTYVAGAWHKDDCAIVDPAKLVWGLRDACLRLGVRIYENTPVAELKHDKRHVTLRVGGGVIVGPQITADHVALATNVFPSLVKRVRPFLAPVYDYALMTEPLSRAQLDEIGWRNRQGVGDSANHFHYYRLTADDRILWGGYDAVYHYGNKIAPELDQRPATFHKLAGHFHETFPQLADLKFTNAWGGVIDTCSRFCAFFGTAYSGRVAYAVGFTGLGVAATRFGANVMLDLLDGTPTARTELRMVRAKPIPFPPEPAKSIGIGLTNWSMTRADQHPAGRRNMWLRTLDRLGLGFDS
jgi:glycine/D-amino acid oxidase-like deaminating enzyme